MDTPEQDPEEGEKIWTPEEEKRRDPANLIDRAEKMMERLQQRADEAFERGPSLAPMPTAFVVRKISNGFLIGDEMMRGPDSLTFFSDAKVGVELFLDALQKMSIRDVRP